MSRAGSAAEPRSGPGLEVGLNERWNPHRRPIVLSLTATGWNIQEHTMPPKPPPQKPPEPLPDRLPVLRIKLPPKDQPEPPPKRPPPPPVVEPPPPVARVGG